MNTGMAKNRVVVIIQGRMSSSRLPGKVLKEIGGRPMLSWVVERARRAKLVDAVAVATTTDPSDDALAEYCQAQGYACLRGSLFDVLDRYYQAARTLQADVVVRLTADCPLIDPDVVDLTVNEFFKAGADFAANRLPPPWHRTFPIGLDTEVCSFAALERAWKEASEKFEREHVMPYLYDQEDRFKVKVVDHDPDYGHLRWTVDTAQDLEMVRKLTAFFNGRDDFSWLEALQVFQQHPELAEINAEVRHKTVSEVDERTQ
jgi:spore coat polysaccharide biosynthesis protein SpsF